MARKKNIALDIFEQAIASVKSLSKFFKTQSHDRRTIKSTQRAAKELFADRRNKEIGEQLGISYQRVTSIKKQVSEGKAYSPELRDVLTSAAKEYNDEPRKLDGGVYFFPNKEKLQKTSKHLDHIKTFPELDDAVNFWKKIIKSDQFIAITQVKQKGGMFYQLVGFGKRAQRPKGGTIQDKRAKNRVDDLLRKFK